MIRHLREEKDFYKRLMTLMMTIALQNVIVFGVNLADNIMLGSYSELALSGVAIVNQIQFFLQMLVMGTGDGMVVLASRYWGKKDIPSIKKIIGVGFKIGFFASVLLFLVVFFFPGQCLGIFTDKPQFVAAGTEYLKIICFSYFFFAITNLLLASLRSVETARIGFFVSLSTLVINVCLNYVLIFGNFGAPELGAEGAAIATLIARIVETAIVLFYVAFIDKKLHIRIRDLLGWDPAYAKQFVKFSAPVILSNVSWGIAQGAQTSILGRLEDSVIAANSISVTVFQILTVVLYASSSATSVMIGKALGEKKTVDTVKQYTKTLQLMYLCFGIMTGLMLFVLKDAVIGFYNITEETRQCALTFMTVLSVTVVGTAYQMPSLGGIVRGGGDTKFVLFNDLIFIWLIVLPSAFLSAFVLELPAVITFLCLKSDQVLKCFVALFKVNRYRWIKTI